jgi:hypothetical protein
VNVTVDVPARAAENALQLLDGFGIRLSAVGGGCCSMQAGSLTGSSASSSTSGTVPYSFGRRPARLSFMPRFSGSA